MKRRLKVNGVIMFLVVLGVVVFPGIFLRSQRFFLGEFAKPWGIFFILFGQLLRTSGRGYKAQHSKEGQALIQGGPYSLVRNPMYLGIFSIGLGIVLVLFQWWVMLIFLAVFSIRYILLVFKEEKKLLAVFPLEYPGYLKRTPRLFPNPLGISRRDITEYLPLKKDWIKKEIGTALALLLAVLLIESIPDIKTGGLTVYLQELVIISIEILLFIGMAVYLLKKTAQE